jgi:hypothetical protein
MRTNQIKAAKYSEWQYPRPGSYLPLLLLIPAVWIVGAPFGSAIGAYIGLAIAIIVAVLKIVGAKKISVYSDSLQLGTATIPKEALGKVEIISKENHFAARGSNLDSRAFVFLKYGLPEMVKIEIVDKKDPTPYLLVSTRKAAQLVAALN